MLHCQSMIVHCCCSQVFIPLTRLCRDSCGYCTFAQPPKPGCRAYMTLEEVLAVCRLGAEQGCTEALFTLGGYIFVQAELLPVRNLPASSLCHSSRKLQEVVACAASGPSCKACSIVLQVGASIRLFWAGTFNHLQDRC